MPSLCVSGKVHIFLDNLILKLDICLGFLLKEDLVPLGIGPKRMHLSDWGDMTATYIIKNKGRVTLIRLKRGQWTKT